jgi:hypothetical protein
MLVPLVCSSGEVVEWALVELQGKIEQQLDVEPGAPLPVGTLQLSSTVRAPRRAPCRAHLRRRGARRVAGGGSSSASAARPARAPTLAPAPRRRAAGRALAVDAAPRSFAPPPPPAPLPNPASRQNKDVVVMQIGYHQIEGKKVPLKKPLAILEKRPGGSGGGCGSGGGSGGGGANASGRQEGDAEMAEDGDGPCGGSQGGSQDGSQDGGAGGCQYEVRAPRGVGLPPPHLARAWSRWRARAHLWHARAPGPGWGAGAAPRGPAWPASRIRLSQPSLRHNPRPPTHPTLPPGHRRRAQQVPLQKPPARADKQARRPRRRRVTAGGLAPWSKSPRLSSGAKARGLGASW